MRSVVHCLWMLVLAAPCAAQSTSQGVVPSFPDTVTILVGAGPGGGFDTNTRIFARHFGKHLPGNPNIVVQNMPGAGGMLVANSIFNTAPKDGSTLGVFAVSVALEHLVGNSQARFDARRFAWIGSLEKDTQSCGVWGGAGQGVTNFDQLLEAKKEIVFGSTSPQATTSQHALMLKALFGAPVKVIYGYRGTADVKAALERGELTASCGLFKSTIRSTFRREFDNGTLKVIVQLGMDGPDPFFGDAVVLHERVKDPDTRELLNFILKQSQLARPLAAPPGTPAEVVSAYRRALLSTSRDPELSDDASRIGVEYNAISGEEMTGIFEEYYSVPRDRIDKAIAVMTPPKSR